MSLPTFPPSSSITREDATNQIISSIAMEEVALSHILNAEGEKIQYVLGTLEGAQPLPEPVTIQNLLDINQSVRETMDSALQSQMFLKNKLATILSSSQNGGDTPVGTNGFILPFSSGDNVANLYARGDGTPSSVSFVSASSINNITDVVSIDQVTRVIGTSFILSADVTVTELWASFILTIGSGTIGRDCEVFAQLYYSNADENTYIAIPETLINLGTIPAATVPGSFTVTNSVSNLSTQLSAGTKISLGVFVESINYPSSLTLTGAINAGMTAVRRS